MTIFGPDISSYQQGMNVSALTDPFVIIKCTEGTYLADADYAGWMGQAKASHKVVIPYHFVKTESSAQSQASMMAAHIGDASLPVMLDVETEGASTPNLPFVLSVIDAMHERGLNVRLVYMPHWYWQQIGSPDLTPLSSRGVGVVSSAYPRSGPLAVAAGYAADGGDAGSGWAPYGGVTPVLWQFTDAGTEQQNIDFNAFRGTIDQLAALLGGGVTDGGQTMGSYTVGTGWQNDYPDVAAQLQKHIPAGTTVDEANAAGYAMIRSFVAAERAAVIEAKLDQLMGRPAPSVDVSALASGVVAAILPHLSGGGVDVDAVAAAVQAHLAQALSRAA